MTLNVDEGMRLAKLADDYAEELYRQRYVAQYTDAPGGIAELCHLAELDFRKWAKANARSLLERAKECEAENKRLREALRALAIKPHRIPYEPITCRICGTGWGHDGPEQHAPDCLLAEKP